MKVVRFYAPGDIRIEESPEPTPGPGEVKIRVRNCSLCGTDLKISKHGNHRITPPRVLGHEIVGEVAKLGAGVAGWAIGDRVHVIGAIPCGDCEECTRGLPTMCTRFEAMGYHYDGGFAEYMLVPAKVLAVGGLIRIPDNIGFAEASVAEPLACVLNGQELARVDAGDTVVVVGAGPVGCLHVRLARARGAAKIMLVDLNGERLARAAGLVQPDEAIFADGDDIVSRVRKATDGRGADVVITANASAAAAEQAVHFAAGRGRVSLFGGLPNGSSMITIDANLVHYRELTVVGANASVPEQNARALQLMASGAVRADDLITHMLPLDGFHEALGMVERGEPMKITIQP